MSEHSNEPSALGRLLDELAIQRVIYCYCRGIDRADPALIRSAFHDDAYDGHSDRRRSRDEFVDWVMELSPNRAASMFFVGNILVDFVDGTDDVAFVESYCVNWTVGSHPEASTAGLTRGVRYIDRFEKRNTVEVPTGEWRIAERLVVNDWQQSAPVELPPAAKLIGQRFPDDASYRFRTAWEQGRRSSG